MTYFLAALSTEILKIRKSKVFWITAVAFTIAPLMAGFFMFVLKDPEFAKNAGFIGVKAQIAGEANWPSYLSLYAQIIAVGGVFVFGFITSWIFGREFADNTIKDLLALPYSRAVIVLAKFVASFMTNIILSVYIVTLGFFIGWLIDIPEWSLPFVAEGLYIVLIVTMMTIILSTPIAFLASFSRGYLVPLGFVIIAVVLSQIVAAAGFGAYFPWAIPALYGGLTGESMLTWNGVIIVCLTSLIGFFSTLYWWLLADQH